MAAGDPRLSLREIIVVEGICDQNAVKAVADATVLTTRGFGIFCDPALRALLRRLARERGVIALTDADGAGLKIRNYLQSILPSGTLRHVYIPSVKGKERRKATPGKAGLLGVEAMPRDLLYSLLEPFACGDLAERKAVTKAELYALGLSGGEGSALRRAALCRKLSLPEYLSAGKLCEVLGLFYDAESLAKICAEEGTENESGGNV